MDATPYGRFVTLVIFDQAIMQIEKECQSLKKKCEELDHKRDDLTKRVETIAFDLKNEMKRRSELELLLNTLAQEKKRIEHKLDITRNAKEYEALQHELSALLKEQNERDDDLIVVWQRVEELEQSLKVAETDTADELKMLEKEREEKRSLLRDLENSLGKKSMQRPSLMEGILEAWLAVYESMRAAQIPNPAITLEGGSCSECGTVIPRTDQEAVEKHQLVFCHQCHRMLFDRYAVE